MCTLDSLLRSIDRSVFFPLPSFLPSCATVLDTHAHSFPQISLGSPLLLKREKTSRQKTSPLLLSCPEMVVLATHARDSQGRLRYIGALYLNLFSQAMRLLTTPSPSRLVLFLQHHFVFFSVTLHPAVRYPISRGIRERKLSAKLAHAQSTPALHTHTH